MFIKNVIRTRLSPIPYALSPGFTLIELLTVIAIIGVLVVSSLVMINPIEQINKGNDAKRKHDLEQLQRALELYYQDNERYPASSADYRIVINTKTFDWGTSWQPYISVLPSDPLPSNRYVYYSPASSNGQTYYLYANVQRGAKDAQACNKGAACASLTQGGSGFPGTNACGGICNYGISSSNVSP